MELFFKHYENIRNEIEDLNKFIYDNPELGLMEVKSSKAHMDLLKNHGFEVENPYMGMETGFKAVFDTKVPGRNIGYLSEYDALPGIGHGCGHNILGAATTGAGILLSKVISNGKVTVFGTPAEETIGGKVILADGGAFENIHAVFCTHPDNEWYKSGSSLAMDSLEFNFTGKTAHASSNPEDGVNALEALILLFNNINAIRQTLNGKETISGIITNGGEAANIIPDTAIGRFHVRAENQEVLNNLTKRVKSSAKAAADAIGCTVSITNYENTFLDLRTNQTMSKYFDEILMDMGIETKVYEGNPGSLDMGNVSYKVPAINPNFKITDNHLSLHTTEFRDKTLEPTALNNLKKVVTAMAKAGKRIIEDDEHYNQILKEFDQNNT